MLVVPRVEEGSLHRCKARLCGLGGLRQVRLGRALGFPCHQTGTGRVAHRQEGNPRALRLHPQTVGVLKIHA